MKKSKFAALAALAVLAGCARKEDAAGKVWDVVVYGSTPAAFTAAIEAKDLGKSAVIVSPDTRMGGLTTGGLGQTDIGNKAAFGGLALQFYRDVATYYKNPANWKWQKRESYMPDGQCSGTKGDDSMWTFEPSAALKILGDWEKRHGLLIHRGEKLDRTPGGVVKSGARIVSIKTLSGKTFKGKVFVDATYEGDLMAAAGVEYFVGRESNSVYNETVNGYAPAAHGFDHHNFEIGVDPYVVKGDPKSGLLPNVEPYNPAEKPGDGDKRVQAYCFRMCLTDVPENRIPFTKPANYRELDYELLFRNYELQVKNHPEWFAKGVKSYWGSGFPWINSFMPNRKTDTNNSLAFSSDFIGRNWAWPEASYEEREKILKEHLDYQRGLMWTLANHPRVPEAVRAEYSRWGMCKDEFLDGAGEGWQRQLYVREARRLVGEYVMTEHNCRGRTVAPRPIAMGAYGMDSHHVRRRVTKEGYVYNEGNVEDYFALDGKTRFPPYPVDFGAILPKKAQCENLLVSVTVSASHIAFGSIRMEPVFFALGQVAGATASLAIDAGSAVQDVDYALLRKRLLERGQVLEMPAAPKK